MKPDPKSDAGLVLRAIAETAIVEPYELAKSIGWVTTRPMMFKNESGAPVEVRIGGGSRYHTERVQVALAALAERGLRPDG